MASSKSTSIVRGSSTRPRSFSNSFEDHDSLFTANLQQKSQDFSSGFGDIFGSARYTPKSDTTTTTSSSFNFDMFCYFFWCIINKYEWSFDLLLHILRVGKWLLGLGEFLLMRVFVFLYFFGCTLALWLWWWQNEMSREENWPNYRYGAHKKLKILSDD